MGKSMNIHFYACVRSLRRVVKPCIILVLSFGVLMAFTTLVMAQYQAANRASGILFLEVLPSDTLLGLYEIKIPTDSDLAPLIAIFPYESKDKPTLRPTQLQQLVGSISGKTVVFLFAPRGWPNNVYIELTTDALPVKVSNEFRRIDLDLDFQPVMSQISPFDCKSTQLSAIEEIAVIMPTIGLSSISEEPEPYKIDGSKRIYSFDDIEKNDRRLVIEYVLAVGQIGILVQTISAIVGSILVGIVTMVTLARPLNRLRPVAFIILAILWLATGFLAFMYFSNSLPLNQHLPFLTPVIIYSIFWTLMTFLPRKPGEVLLRES